MTQVFYYHKTSAPSFSLITLASPPLIRHIIGCSTMAPYIEGIHVALASPSGSSLIIQFVLFFPHISVLNISHFDIFLFVYFTMSLDIYGCIKKIKTTYSLEQMCIIHTLVKSTLVLYYLFKISR